MVPRLIVIAARDSRRWQQFKQQADELNKSKMLQDTQLVDWHSVIKSRGSLDGLSTFDQPAYVRIDSIGESYELARMLLVEGDRLLHEQTAASEAETFESEWQNVEQRKGWLLRPSLINQGLGSVLSGLEDSFNKRPHLKPLSRPSHVAEMFNKRLTSAKLRSAGLPCPDELETSGLENGRQVLEAIRKTDQSLWFAKLNSGSSATGIAAITSQPVVSAQTSMLRIDDRIFNTLQLQTVDEAGLIPLLDFLLEEGLCLQQGIQKACLDGANFDLRVILIDGVPEFTIIRSSSAPMTNLHFGGQRKRPEECRRDIPTRAWLDAMDSCVAAAGLFDAQMVGVDLTFERGYFRHFILEVNAFGDFFPGWKNADGITIYQRQLERIAQRASGDTPQVD